MSLNPKTISKNKIISITEAASIAIHVMVLIAKAGKQNINVRKLTEQTGAAKNHVAKVMQLLVKQGLILSTRGPQGGFVLSCPASNYTLLSIYEAVEGTIDLPECPFDNKVCPFHKCLMDGIIHKLTDDIRNYFGSQKLSDMLE